MSSIQKKIADLLGRVGARVALLALCGAVLSAVPMLAQGPQGQGGPGPWGGRGGPRHMQEHQLEMMTKQLNLSPDQVSQIKGIFADEDTQMKALRDDTSGDRREKMFSIRKDSHTKVLGVLSNEQKTTWEAFEAKMRERREEHQHENGGGPPPPQQ
jgi:protein CpxP